MSGLYALSNYDWIITRNKRDMALFLLSITGGENGDACQICAYLNDKIACGTHKCSEGIAAWLDGRHEA